MSRSEVVEKVEPAEVPPDFDPVVLEQFLRGAVLGGASGEFRLERIAGGQSNPTFFVTLAARRMVMRKKPAGVILPSAHAVDREYRVLTALADTDVPAPRALLVVEPENAPLVLSTFESKRLVARVAAPVGGRHVRVMNLYDVGGYRGPADLNAAQSR